MFSPTRLDFVRLYMAPVYETAMRAGYSRIPHDLFSWNESVNKTNEAATVGAALDQSILGWRLEFTSQATPILMA